MFCLYSYGLTMLSQTFSLYQLLRISFSPLLWCHVHKTHWYELDIAWKVLGYVFVWFSHLSAGVKFTWE